jgi:hypothetical protein
MRIMAVSFLFLFSMVLGFVWESAQLWSSLSPDCVVVIDPADDTVAMPPQLSLKGIWI